MKTFKVGQQLETRSICDHDCIFRAEVTKRTAKTVTFNYMGRIQTRKIFIYDDAESIKPFGSYSMAPTFRAS